MYFADWPDSWPYNHHFAEVDWHPAVSLRGEGEFDVEPGTTVCGPGEGFCTLLVGPKDIQPWAGRPKGTPSLGVPVETFGTLVERLVPAGGRVERGEPLFLFEARSPTTEEWLHEHRLAHEHAMNEYRYRNILYRHPFKASTWRWSREGRELRRWFNENARQLYEERENPVQPPA